MFAFHVRNRLNAAASPRTPRDPASPSTAVGEIDTTAPFESVKAAVNLFGEASPRTLKKAKTIQERVLEKETQLHWILKELDKFKEDIKAAESTRAQALHELESVNTTLHDLTNNLETISESKQAAIEATEAAKTRALKLEQVKSSQDQAWQDDIDNEIRKYKTSANQLISAKQERTNLKQDFDRALEAKLAAFQQSADAQHVAKVNREKMNHLSKEVDSMRHTLERVRLASAKAEEDHAMRMEEKEAVVDSKRKAKDDIDMKIESLKKEVEEQGNLKKKLEETTGAINVLREQLNEVRAADMELLGNANTELHEAKRRLEELKKEDGSLREMVDSLKHEAEQVRRDVCVLKERELKREELQSQVEQLKLEFEKATIEKTKTTNDVKEMELKIQELLLVAQKARMEQEGMKKEAEALWRERDNSEKAIKEAEVKLKNAEREVEEARAAEELANDEMRKRSREEPASKDVSWDQNQIILTTEEFEALSTQTEEATSAADNKVATASAEVEAIKKRERETLEKMEKTMEESKGIEAEINSALKMAEEADAARQAIQAELNKLRQTSF